MTQEQLDYAQDYHELPSGWECVRLGSICDANNGRAFKSTEWRDGGLPIIRIQNLKDPEAPFNYFQGDLKDQHRVASGDLLFAWSGTPGTSFGAHIWKGPDAALNQHIFNICFDRDEIDPKYFLYALNQNVTRYVEQAQGGVGLAHITKSKFLASSIPLAPLPQQKRIVAEIEKQFSRLDEAVANLKRVKANLKRYKAAVLKAAVEGKLTEDWRKAHPDVEPASKLLDRILAERRAKWEEAELAKMEANGKVPKNDKWKTKYKEPASPDEIELPRLPSNWQWSNFESVSERVTVGHVGSMKDEYVEEGIPFLRSQNVRPNRYDAEGLKYISEQFHQQLAKSSLDPGDIVVVRSGSVGVTCVVPDILPVANCSDLVIIKSPQAVLPDYGAYYMNSVVETRVAAGKVGVALTHFNTQSVARMPVPVPPAGEQDRVVGEVDRRLSLIRETETQVNANLQRAERLRQSILSQAFSGQLLVNGSEPLVAAAAG